MVTNHATRSGPCRGRLTFVASYLQRFGGVEQLLISFVEQARDDGWEVTVVSPRRLEPGGFLERSLAHLATLISAEGQWQRRPAARAWRSAAWVRASIRARAWPDQAERASLGGSRAKPYLDGFWGRPQGAAILERSDVVHVLGSHPFGAHAMAAAGRFRVPLVYSETTTPSVSSSVDPYYSPFREALNVATVVTTHSTLAAHAFMEHYAYSGDIRVVDQWLEPALESQLLALTPAPVAEEGGPLNVGSLSRLVDGKGLETLIDGFAIAIRRGCAATLVIAGDGPAGASLRQRTAAAGVSDRVTFPGRIDPSARCEFLARLDAFAIGSVAETGPFTGLEAMAAARAVLSTPVGAMPDRLTGADGCFFESGDGEGFARGLQRLDRERAELGRRAEAARASYLRRNAGLEAVAQDLWRYVAKASP